jgi:dihydroxyacid dehydratase/phosphogluconate dehydratase
MVSIVRPTAPSCGRWGSTMRALAKPMIGVVSMKGEQTPCNMTHDFQVDAAKAGIAEAGGHAAGIHHRFGL